MKKIALIIIFILLNTVNCFANTYTKQQLQQGQQKAIKIWNDLELQYVGIGENKLIAYSSDWTEEQKELFIETTGIQNVIFNYGSLLPKMDNDPYGTVQKYITTPMYIAEIQSNNEILVKNRVGVVNDKVVFDTISFSQKPYLKNGNIMIPLKEMINIENERRGISKNVIYQKQSMTFSGNKITFYKGKRDAIVNDIKMGLYEIPDIKQNDVFVSAQDLNMIFEDNADNFEKEHIRWKFSMKWKGNNDIYIYHTPYDERDRKIITISENMSDKVNFTAYNKNNNMMVALEDISKKSYIFHRDFEEIKNDENTVTLKLWNTLSKDVVFTKDSNKMIVNGIEMEMQQAAEIKNNKMYIPITALFEILEIPQNDIKWLNQETVKITC